jgi:para-nitrobenzyl esterase
MATGIRPAFGSLGKLLIGMLAAGALLASSAAPVAAQPVVPTDRGLVQGVETPVLTKYLGIPYAAPPVGNLRWRAPQPPARWTQTLVADDYAPHCAQPASPFGRPSTSEDCLYLNVYTPLGAKAVGPKRGSRARRRTPKDKGAPVMVWIHGGALAVGESDEYDPTKLVRKGVIVVTINYRLGWLGFLAHPALSAETAYHGSGDYGLMDQQAALGWVKRNISRFGGDRGNVTIFGQSAGGLSVHSHLASPGSAGLFNKAIAQSGAYVLDLPSLASSETRGTNFAASSGCPDQTAACLRQIPVETILHSQPTETGSVLPNIDGKVLTRSYRSAFTSGQFNRVPVVEGSTHDEFSLFAYTNIEAVFGVLPPELYSVVVNTLLQTLGVPADAAAVQAEYPVASYNNSVGEAITALGTDMLFACNGRTAAQLLSKYVPVYTYEFNDPNAPQLFVPPASFPYRAYHGAEVQYLFDVPNQTGVPGLNGEQMKLADTMKTYWTQFARTGQPTAKGTPYWNRYLPTTETFQSLAPPVPQRTTAFATDHKCAFWASQLAAP